MIDGIDEARIGAAIEALLFVTDEPLSAITIAQMLEVETSEATRALAELKASLEEEGRGIQLMEVAGGWRLFTHPEFHDLLEKYILSWDTRRLSAAALEVLAIVAYLQPATRAQISAIRGVTSDGPLNTLIERGYVREAGVLEAPGNPTLYATTRTFLEKYGMTSPKELPNLDDFAPDENTARLIRERLGALAPDASDAHVPDERDLPSPEELVGQAQASMFGVVDKIDFDKLTFNTDDE